MQKIINFQVGRKYYPNQQSKLFRILSRNGKVLKVARIHLNDEDVFTVTTSYAADAKDAYEYFIYDGARVPATNLLPVGRSISELPAEERAMIQEAVQRDVEFRRSKHLNSANVLTKHNADGTIEREFYFEVQRTPKSKLNINLQYLAK